MGIPIIGRNPDDPDWYVGEFIAARTLDTVHLRVLLPYVHRDTIPSWAVEVVRLSREGRDTRINRWLSWCAEAGAEARKRADAILTIARTAAIRGDKGRAVDEIDEMIRRSPIPDKPLILPA